MVLFSKLPVCVEAVVIRPNYNAIAVFLTGRTKTRHALSPP
jgi:hypothetical protein